MTRDPTTASEDTPLGEIVDLMERHQIKRIPIVRGDHVVGIVSRANLLHALATLDREARPVSTDDSAIHDRIVAELDKQTWAPKNLINVVVRDGVVDLWGVVVADNQREATAVLVENVPGVKRVRNHLSWVEPTSGTVIYSPDDEDVERKAS